MMNFEMVTEDKGTVTLKGDITIPKLIKSVKESEGNCFE